MQYNIIKITTLAVVLCIIFIIYSCKAFYLRTQYEDFNSLIHSKDKVVNSSFLKAHLKNGNVSILKNNWNYDTLETHIHGYGSIYDFNRNQIFEGPINILIDSVLIFETNRSPRPRIQALSIITALDVMLAIPCYILPKACFGSCPTFYLDGSASDLPEAEGFSNAIAPSLEYGDIDALGRRSGSEEVKITVKNEALETHCLNKIELLVVSCPDYGKVFHTQLDEFYYGSVPLPPKSAIGPEGEITSLISNSDQIERFSLADTLNLKSKEEIYLEFLPDSEMKSPGLSLHFRQTLMTTYFIYSALGYMGDQVGDIFASIENGNIQKNKIENSIYKELGEIEVYIFDESNKTYILQGGFYETGPIAINKQLIKLNAFSGKLPVKIKLLLNKGLWRIDYIGLTELNAKIEPFKISPYKVDFNRMTQRKSTEILTGKEHHWINLPGQEITLSFELPCQDGDYELFLFSKGYYLEWIRSNWISDKNLMKLNLMIQHPEQYLKEQTNEYIKYESEMENLFWNSKIGINSINHENYK